MCVGQVDCGTNHHPTCHGEGRSGGGGDPLQLSVGMYFYNGMAYKHIQERGHAHERWKVHRDVPNRGTVAWPFKHQVCFFLLCCCISGDKAVKGDASLLRVLGCLTLGHTLMGVMRI